MNDSHHDFNIGTESAVLMAITGLGPTPPAGGASRHWSSSIDFSSTYLWCPSGRVHSTAQHEMECSRILDGMCWSKPRVHRNLC
ncbi:hypothetical protein AVEN_197790-1 [Araneus ventricosus]|uniref:Uncharacterized protein n=1 Tax=Araneus ventricosus TaxID=182803 RepID=A0A4Y2HMT7_ARAVE|nr:hypothetical protein AVEN_197790-1 [Araneus ventricosus]